MDQKLVAWDLALTYVRLGRLQEQLGKKDDPERAFSEALNASKKIGVS